MSIVMLVTFTPLSLLQAAADGIKEIDFTQEKAISADVVDSVAAVSYTHLKDGEEIGYVSGKKLKEDGRYSLTIENYDGSLKTYTFTIDTIPPEVLLEGVKNGGKTTDSVTISKLSEEAEVKVYLNNNEIGYKLGEKLTKAGKYRRF